ncbi:hypothetical protein ALO80_101847 [Pseudomonas caricapapayae]|uniref:Uncharacterized protein n=1 Tax=Pseudomonas caricapapayae TaxID=46678 RepID=A0A0P9MEV1_9PSED|nr:hypothetical protein [Pseudomonas caricapapayae]KAA8689559.1 hypothetical protein F4W67_27425 [Pseudomonas caricapapayae]KPW56672.1 hypothetical protein ALO80_101847 [Pseudomonas caricapapayae]RMM09269.1 hypothetical protein ALQ84_03126 [Pseudomonas caricapapayae]
MKITDLDVGKMIGPISNAIFPVVFEGVDGSAPASELRKRASLHSEIMGRIMGVLLCGDEVGHDVVGLIEQSIVRMKESNSQAFGELLGPGGSLSKIHKN